MSVALSRVAFHVPATIAGWQDTARNWSMTVALISSEGTRSTEHDPVP